MSELRFEKVQFRSANFGEESSLPPIAVKLSLSDISNKYCLEEDDGLFINYGAVESAYPYKYQDLYDRSLTPIEYETAVLENSYLKAVFLPTFGGKLFSLVDKTTGRELLYKNEVIRPCNLAVRNAWLAGGIEWNACFKGHGPFTCSPINTAVTKLDDGTPVLRFYYFERIRCAVVQMDVFLPDASKMLFVRVRLTNPNETVIPMYWWSNAAIVEKPGDRVIVPAKQTYTAPNNDVVKIDVPIHNGIDITYPAENITCNDFFWKLDEKKRKYICQLDREGYGICQTSTARLQGRKLFEWGNSQGGHRWMNFLTADGSSGRYDEIQCGIAKSQFECLPMPPHTVWEWIEAYGAMQADPKKIHGNWETAQEEAESQLDRLISAERLDAWLTETRKMAKRPAGKEIICCDGWGSLELMRRRKTGDSALLMNDHLSFGPLTDEQKDWIMLLEQGTVGVHDATETPKSYQIQEAWLELLKKALDGADKENWYAWYLYGTAMIARSELDQAQVALQKSIELQKNVWTFYALSIYHRDRKDSESELFYMRKAYELGRGNLSLAKEVFRCLFTYEKSMETIELFESEREEIKSNKRCLLYYAYALARTGRLDEADRILCNEKGEYLVVPDVRECELTVTKLWYYIREQRGITRDQCEEVPRELDFRMFTAREGWF